MKSKQLINQDLNNKINDKIISLRKSNFTPNLVSLKEPFSLKPNSICEDLKLQQEKIKHRSNILMKTLQEEQSKQYMITNLKFDQIWKPRFSLMNVKIKIWIFLI